MSNGGGKSEEMEDKRKGKGMKSVKDRERKREREARRINVHAFATCVCMSACMRKRIVPGALDNVNFSRTRGDSLSRVQPVHTLYLMYNPSIIDTLFSLRLRKRKRDR